MRRLSPEEKRIARLINDGKGNSLAILLDPFLLGVRISITEQPHDVELLFETQSAVPTSDEESIIVEKIRRLSIEIVTVVNLINLLEKENYIILYQPARTDYPIEIGRGAFNLPSTSSRVFDPKITDLLIDYATKDIIATAELSAFVKHGFITRDEQRYRIQLCVSSIAIVIALFAALTNFGFNLWTKLTGGTQIQQDQIDTVTKEMIKIENRLDTLILVTKQSHTKQEPSKAKHKDGE